MDYTSYYSEHIRKVKEAAKKSIVAEKRAAWQEYFTITDKRVQEMFKKAVDDFYADYTPEYYIRSRSLYNILDTKSLDGGMAFSISYDPAKMTKFRNGYAGEDGLYDQVFRKGWHGGSDGAEHTGFPRWRMPYQVYSRWGRFAPIANPSPLAHMQSMLKDYEDAETPDSVTSLMRARLKNMKINL